MLKLIVQGEADVSKNQLTSQFEVFSSMRAALLAGLDSRRDLQVVLLNRLAH